MDMLIIRVGGDDTLRNSKPCRHCLDTLRMFGVRRVYYSTNDGGITVCRTSEMETEHRTWGQRKYSHILSERYIHKN